MPAGGDGAYSRLTAVSWAGPQHDAVELLSGELGEVAVEGSAFRADLNGSSSGLSKAVCPITSPECRAIFGDKHCQVDLGRRSLRAVIVDVAGNELRLDRMAGPQYAGGRLRWLTGANCGLKSFVAISEGSVVRLRQPPRMAVRTGDRVQLFEGCDKRLETCRTRFDNAANFRGEPHLPGNDLLTRYPGA